MTNMLTIGALSKEITSVFSFISYLLVSTPSLPTTLYVLGFAFSKAMAKKNRK